MKLDKILFILGTIFVTIGVLLIFASSILSRFGYSRLSDIFWTISAVLGVLSLGILIFRLVAMTKRIDNGFNQNTKVVVKVVDVKDVPKSREEQLYEQYEDLYKKNLITKEDLDLKRKELLGK